MRKTTLRTLASLAVLVALGAPHATSPQTCTQPSARNLLGGALADAFINGPGQEDNQFFTSQGGIPNIYFLMDTGTSMARLPPNGPVLLGPAGAAPGCGTAAVEGGLDPAVASTLLSVMNGLAYHSPCGTAAATVEGQPYQGAANYWSAATACPYYTQGSNAFVTPSPGGFDPDFPAFFPAGQVFHGYGADGLDWVRTGPGATDHNFGNGWNFTRPIPYSSQTGRNATPATVAGFCTDQGTSSAVCTQCLTTRGWYYDGTTLTGTYDGVANVAFPSVWFTGNFLNFFPPKFMVARKVVKDVIGYQARVRMAVGGLSATGLAPAPNPADAFGPTCSQILNNNANWDSSRSTVVNGVNTLTWGAGKNLANALFDVGRYYHTPTLPWFGTAWASGPLSATSANQLAVCWSCQTSSVILLTDGIAAATDGANLPTNPSSISDSNSGKYAGDPTTGVLNPDSTDCPLCWDLSGTDAWRNSLAKVSFYLQNYDLRSEAAGACGGTGGTLDGRGMPGKQVMDLYTVGFATNASYAATRVLGDAAAVGGGEFISADATDQLKQGIAKTFSDINTRATSFSVATVSTLQTTTGHSVIVPRFDPSRDAYWAGHLYRYELYSEFVNNCTPNGPGDLDCDGACGSVFLQDKNGKFIAEDGNGNFIETGDLPACALTPQCVAQGKPCGSFSDPPIPANPWWDAYEALRQQSWKQRAVWTVVDAAAPFGQLDGADGDAGMIRLDPTDATAVAALRPYLGLGTTGASGGVCGTISRKIALAGDPYTAAVVAADKNECAKALIRFVLGADVWNDMGRTPAQGWPPPAANPNQPVSATNLPDQNQLLDRKFKLGDIYHSSPVVVDAPLPADGILCPNGLHNQCMESLWRTPVQPAVAGTNQYDLYAKSTPYQNRRKITLVGANDGMLHAFNAGKWHPNADDPVTLNVDESQPPFNGYYDRGEEDGPVELWAFIPPDLLGKLSSLVSGDHQLFVDGTAMVRDVWVDGVGNTITDPPPTVDDMKAASEFHTVAVVGERRGGNHYFALDVTDATKLKSETGTAWPKPRFLWIYPQPNDPESLAFGETYTDFLPIPPPIGPVRIQADGNSGVAMTNTPTMAVAGVATPVPYHERWVAMLPGGFDPQGLRGRGVHMVDVWTGKEVFDFSYPTATASAGDPRLGLTFPIAAMPSMVMWGTAVRRPSLSFENDGYFDTATFGDTGGQLWALRFSAPGTLDANGRATNWFGGRIFQMGWGGSNGSLCNTRGGQPFFYATANTALPGSHVFRVYAGTGDRFNLLDTNGGVCGPDNLRACAQKGCSVTLAATNNTFAMTGAGSTGSDARSETQAACSSASQTDFAVTQNLAGTAPTCGVQEGAYIAVAGCANATSATGFTKDVAVTCTQDADGDYGCRVGTSLSPGSGVSSPGTSVDQSTANSTWSSYPQSRNWYYSLRVFDDAGSRTLFTSASGAASYDSGRYWLSDNTTSTNPFGASWTWYGGFAWIDGGSNSPSTTATATSPGWAIYYRHGPTITTDGHSYNVNLLDERTSSVSGLYGKVLWNTLQPPLGEATSTTACATSKCTAAFRRLSYHYGADAITGAPVFTDSSGNPLRSIVQNTLVPAQGDQPTVFVNQKGQLAVGLTAVNPEKGASNLGMGAAMDPVMSLGAVEVSRELHDCRHFKAAAADGTLTAAERATLAGKCQ